MCDKAKPAVAGDDGQGLVKSANCADLFDGSLSIVSIITHPNPGRHIAGRASDCRMCVKCSMIKL